MTMPSLDDATLTAAGLMAFFAKLTYDPIKFSEEGTWYEWTTKEYCKVQCDADPLLPSVWHSIRFAYDRKGKVKDDDDWETYFRYVYAQALERRERAPAFYGLSDTKIVGTKARLREFAKNEWGMAALRKAFSALGLQPTAEERGLLEPLVQGGVVRELRDGRLDVLPALRQQVKVLLDPPVVLALGSSVPYTAIALAGLDRGLAELLLPLPPKAEPVVPLGVCMSTELSPRQVVAQRKRARKAAKRAQANKKR